MTKTLSTLAAVLLAGSVAFAQGGYPSGSTGSGNTGSDSGASAGSSGQSKSSGMNNQDQDKITGCLSGSEGNYTLSSATGTTYPSKARKAT